MRPRICVLMAACVWIPMASARAQTDAKAIAVEPAELSRRSDLVGREVIVDDHVKFYVPRTGTEADELQLKRTPITFEVPRRLRPTNSSPSSVIVRGVLKREGSRLVCAVNDVQPVGGDLDRLSRGVASLSAKDFEGRKAWARWAERRATDFKNKALGDRAKSIEAEALRIESEMKRLGVDAPGEWLTMAKNGRRRGVTEPEPSALAHRAFRAKLAVATTAAEFTALIEEINDFFPKAATNRAAGKRDLSSWEARYGEDPAGTYRAAPQQVREALDRRTWVDATVQLLEHQASQNLLSAIAAAEQAATLVPEKPTFPVHLMEKAANAARRELETLRLSEIKTLAEVYREKLRQPAEARAILGDWLKIQQDRLSTTDAEGPLELATLYEELIADRVTAIELLRRAWRIDPASKEIAEAFRVRGFHKVNDDWAEPAPSERERPAAEASADMHSLSAAPRGLRGLTAEEVRARLGGKPDRVNYVAARGQLIEQWIYHLDNKRVRFVNLLHSPEELKPRVMADYTLPVSSFRGGMGSGH